MILSKLSKPKAFSTLSPPRRSRRRPPPSLPTLLKSCFTPTLQDFNKFLLFLSQSHKFNFILHFFSQLSSNHINGDSFTHSIFAKSLLYERKYEAALHFIKTSMLDTSITKQSRLWDSIIQGFCVDRKDPEMGFLVLQDCLKIDGILPSSFTFCSLIRCFSCQGKMDRAIEVLEMMAHEKVKYPFDNFVLSSVICGFVSIGKHELAVGFYENALKLTNLQPNIVTYTAVLSAYCRLGRVEEVCGLVSRIEKDGLMVDVVFYGSWVYESFREGDVGKALQKHREMVERKIELDMISYTILVDGFSKEGNVEKAIGFLHKMRKDGLIPNLITCTAIISGFCKKGKLEEAFTMFKMVEDLGMVPDEFAYATLIDGVCRSGDFDRVFSLLDEMEKKAIHPSIVTYNTVINGLCKARRMAEADEVSKSVLGDVVTYSTLLHGYIKEEDAKGMLETKRRLEDAQVCMDVVMCNIVIKALFMVGSFENALELYKGMPEMGLAANHVTYCTMVDGYCKVGRIDEALEIFDEFRRTSISSVACYNCIIHGLCKKGMVDMAVEVFIELNERELPLDVGIHTMLLKAIFRDKGAQGILEYIFKIEFLVRERFGIICNDALFFLCQRGFSEAANDVYMVMWRKGSVVAIRSYYSILDLLICDGKMSLTQAILTNFVKYGVLEPKAITIIICYLCMKDVKLALKFHQKKKGNTGSVTFPVSVLEKLTKNGRVVDAYTLVMGVKDNLPLMDVIDYSIMIDGLCKGGHIGKALDLCALARKKGITLNIITYNSLINGLCRQGCFVEAFRLFDSLEKIDVVPSEITYATLINTLSKEGYMVNARQLLEKMILKGMEPNTRVYNSLIHGYCKLGQLQDGLKLILDLEANFLKPDEFTVRAVIYGCYQNGDMEGALESYFDFKRKEIFPDFLGFLYLARGLYSKGRMEESRSVLREMLQTPSVLNLLNRVDTGGETESVEHFLEFLCDQGSIKEAITVLDEVGSMFFPIGRRSGAHNDGSVFTIESKSVVSTNETFSDLKLCNGDNFDQVVKNDDNLCGTPQLFDFNSFYAEIASFCSRGEVQKANKLAKVFCGFKEGS